MSGCGTFRHDWIGLERLADGVWSVWFYDRVLARLDERNYTLRG